MSSEQQPPSSGLATFHHSRFPVELLEDRAVGVSVCFPARDEAGTIAAVLEPALRLRARGLVDQVVVVDESSDGTDEIARRLGAEVYRQSELQPSFGPVLGKGDAMWRALSVLEGDLVVFLDADSEQLGVHYIAGLVGPLLGGADFVKGFYRRPFKDSGEMPAQEGGGRVTELTAKPLLRIFHPQLAAFRQPLAGEIGARAELLRQLPFSTGYGVDVSLLIGAYKAVGLDRLAQVDLDVRQNRHQPLSALGPMADQVVAAILARGGLMTRPPSASLDPATVGGGA